MNEYGIYIRALILRYNGRILESLEVFKQCLMINSTSSEYLKQIGKALFLLGKARLALELFESGINIDKSDWEMLFFKGLCYYTLNTTDLAIAFMNQSLSVKKTEIV